MSKQIILARAPRGDRINKGELTLSEDASKYSKLKGNYDRVVSPYIYIDMNMHIPTIPLSPTGSKNRDREREKKKERKRDNRPSSPPSSRSFQSILYTHTHTYIHIYIYIYIERERERREEEEEDICML